MSKSGPEPELSETKADAGPLEMPDAFPARHKKKGLAALLFLLGGRKNILLVALVGGAAALMIGVAAVTGKLTPGRGSKQLSAIEQAKQLEARLKLDAELEAAADEAAKAAQGYGLLAGVPGKARSLANAALNYVSHDAKYIKGAEYLIEGVDDQREKEGKAGEDTDAVKVDAAKEGADAAGLAAAAAGGALGKEGAGSLALATPGQGLFGGKGGGGMDVADSKGMAIGAALRRHGNAPNVKGASFTPGTGTKGRLSPMQARKVNARITAAGRRMSDPSRNTRSKSMWALVKATAYTMASLCPNCNRESVAVYNRAYATGELTEGMGVVLLPDDAGTMVSRASANHMMSSGGGGAAEVSEMAEDCMKAVGAHEPRQAQIMDKLAKLRWDGGSLEQKPKKCCKVKNYNSKVDEYKALCAERNDLVRKVNKACKSAPESGVSDPRCGQYNTVEECGWLKCYALFIALMALAAFLGPGFLLLAFVGFSLFGSDEMPEETKGAAQIIVGAIIIVAAVVATVFTLGMAAPVAAALVVAGAALIYSGTQSGKEE